MTTPAKLYGKDLSEYDEVDVDELLAQLSAEEIKILAKEVDPDVSISLFFSKLFFVFCFATFKLYICVILEFNLKTSNFKTFYSTRQKKAIQEEKSNRHYLRLVS